MPSSYVRGVPVTVFAVLFISLVAHAATTTPAQLLLNALTPPASSANPTLVSPDTNLPPSGFDPSVWGYSPAINNSYPYLWWQPLIFRTVAHDFNHDGKSDVPWRDTSGNVAGWLMNGTSVLNPNTAGVGNVPISWSIVGTGDFNGDGNLDLFWRDSSGNVAIWEINGTTVLNANTAGFGNVPTVWTIQDPLGQ